MLLFALILFSVLAVVDMDKDCLISNPEPVYTA